MAVINYSEPLFRPPSEARSLILQPTIGCSWNKCSFCEMYTSKSFKLKPESELFKEIESLVAYSSNVRKVFIADGNAMVLSYDRLMRIIDKLNSTFPKLSRISAYALPSDLGTKSISQLEKLREGGLKLIYTGIETGDDELLKLINKSETYNSTVEGLTKAKMAGIKMSVMILNGLGGKNYSIQHANNSATLINEIMPDYLSTLVLSYPYGVDHFKSRSNFNFQPLSKYELIAEIKSFLQELKLEDTIFRSDHASNYVTLKGILNKDKNKLLGELMLVLENFNEELLKPEWLRGL